MTCGPGKGKGLCRLIYKDFFFDFFFAIIEEAEVIGRGTEWQIYLAPGIITQCCTRDTNKGQKEKDA